MNVSPYVFKEVKQVDNTAIQQQYTIETSQQASEAMKKSADAIMEALKPVIEAFKRWAKALWDKLMKAAAMNANPKPGSPPPPGARQENKELIAC